MIAVYTVVITYFCELRFENFWAAAFDLGVNQQLLWTGSHGYLLYETPDRMMTGIHSFLEIHSTYVAFLVAAVYGALPYPTTLFALESAGAGSAIIPLYLIARRSSLGPSLVFPLLALYLVNFGVIAALLYDFHWEAFLPAELLWFYLLVRQKSYALALAPTVIGFLTLEVYPVLAAGVVVLLLYEKVRQLGLRPRAWLHDRDVRIALGFLAVLAILYGLFLLLEHQVIPAFVGTQGTVGVYSGPNPSYRFSATAQTVPGSAAYWLLLLASLGFLPLFSPRSLIPSIPWFVESVFLQPYYSSSAFGSQFALVALATLSIAFVEGFIQFSRWASTPARSTIMTGTLLAAGAGSSMVAVAYSASLLSSDPPTMVLLLFVCQTVGIVALVAVLFRRHRWAFPPRFGHRTSFRTQLVLALVLAAAMSDVLLFDVLALSLARLPDPTSVAYVWYSLLVPPLLALAAYLFYGRMQGSTNHTTSAEPRAARGGQPSVRASLWATTVVAFVGFNLVMSPLNTLNFDAPHRGGYLFEYSTSPTSRLMGWIVRFIPPNAVILEAGDLFPYAPNDPNAWSAFGCGTGPGCRPYLPFNGTNLPQFVLIDGLEWNQFPASVQSALANPSEYGLVAEIISNNSIVGPDYIFELGFVGVPQVRDA